MFWCARRRGLPLACAFACVIELSSHVCHSRAAYTSVQYNALEALFNTTNGTGWLISTGWRNSTLGLCSWYGITCNMDGNVTGISLSDNELIGNLSEASGLHDAVSLQEIDLSNNRLSGVIPLGFGLMPQLEKLDLSGNRFSFFPPRWGSGAGQLQHLSVQYNNISGSLPTAWMEVNDSTSYPLVHLSPESTWFPKLRTLEFRGNAINMTAYEALQTIAGWKSLQACDLGANHLTGPINSALTLYHCDGSGSTGCAGIENGTAMPYLRVLMLDGNRLTGLLPPELDTGDRRIEMLDISRNDGIEGEIPESYSELLLLLADGTHLSNSSLPTFVEAATTYESIHNASICLPVDAVPGKDIVAVTLGPFYDGYARCTCRNGYGGSGQDCSECPVGWYGHVEDTGGCVMCPSNSTTLQTGCWKGSQCLCSPGFYDQLGGLSNIPSCTECPEKSKTLSVGATNETLCQCEPGYVQDAITGKCKIMEISAELRRRMHSITKSFSVDFKVCCSPSSTEGHSCGCHDPESMESFPRACSPGTYKATYGNDESLCLSCPAGFYLEAVGATSSATCEPCPMGSYGIFPRALSATNCTACPVGTYGIVEGLSSESHCTRCWPGYYSTVLGATSASTCIECPSNFSQPDYGASSFLDCVPCSNGQVSESGSSGCYGEVTEDGTLVGLYLLIAGIFMVIFTLAYIFLQKHCRAEMPVSEKVHMKLNQEMKSFIAGQQFWISMFSGVEIMDLMSDLGAYASLLYTAALTGAMKIVYTIVLAFALMASLHGVHTRAFIIMDMQEERTVGLAITGNNMLYYEKQFNILQIMTQKRTCQRHVPFDRGNKYLSHHIGVQRLISLNSMRIIIAIFEDVPFLGLNLYLLLQQPDLSKNIVFMMSFVMSIFVLGYKMTLLEKHARLQIRKWNLEARMDTDTMLNKKAARGRRFSWSCQQCQLEDKRASSIARKQQQSGVVPDATATSAISTTSSGSMGIPDRTRGSDCRTEAEQSTSPAGDEAPLIPTGLSISHDAIASTGRHVTTSNDSAGPKSISPCTSPASVWSKCKGLYRRRRGRGGNTVLPSEGQGGVGS